VIPTHFSVSFSLTILIFCNSKAVILRFLYRISRGKSHFLNVQTKQGLFVHKVSYARSTPSLVVDRRPLRSRHRSTSGREQCWFCISTHSFTW